MFGWPPSGTLAPDSAGPAFQALTARDYPVVLAEFTLIAIMTLAGILLADILYSVVDPRISFSKKAA